MATTTGKSYNVARLDELGKAPSFTPGGNDDGRERVDVRNHFGITSFGINAVRIPGAGTLVREHDELGGLGNSEQEELYIVLGGAATFEVDGEKIEAPTGTFVFVRPEAKRSAVASEEGTTLLIIGGTPGKAYDVLPAEAAEAFAAYNAGDYETAAKKQAVALEQRPDSVLVVFNAACFEAKAGHADAAFEHLQRAVTLDDRVREYLEKDEDLDSLREDPRFAVLAK
jgi:tetratricopeptide (TPR) repeat protein